MIESVSSNTHQYTHIGDTLPCYITILKNKLRKVYYLNYISIIIHGFSSIIMIYLLSINKNTYYVPYTMSYQSWESLKKTNITKYNCINEYGGRLFTNNHEEFCIFTKYYTIKCINYKDDYCFGLNLGYLVIFFHIASFVFQLCAIITDFTGPILGYKYESMIMLSKNPLRFIEYSISASIMLVSIAIVNGITNFDIIFSIAILSAVCQLCGLVVEYIKEIELKWLVYLIGWLQFGWAYTMIFLTFFRAMYNSYSKPPNFLYIIVYDLFFFYLSFGFVQFIELIYLTHLRCTEPCCKSNKLDPCIKEMMYITLSLISKTLLGWIIFFNVLINNNI